MQRQNPPAAPSPKSVKKDRLAAALKANLIRRKAAPKPAKKLT